MQPEQAIPLLFVLAAIFSYINERFLRISNRFDSGSLCRHLVRAAATYSGIAGSQRRLRS